VDVPVAVGFEDPVRLGPVGLAAGDVGPDGLRGQKDDPVTLALELASPGVGRPSGLQGDGGRLSGGEERGEPRTGDLVGLGDLSRVVGDGDLGHGLGDIHGDGRMLHGGLLVTKTGLNVTGDSGTMMPLESREDCLASKKRTTRGAVGSLQRSGAVMGATVGAPF